MMARDTEDQHQRALATYLDAIGVLWFHTPNEAKRTKAARGRLKAHGMKAGVPDVIVLTAAANGRPTALELKRLNGRPTKAQLAFLDRADAEGWNAAVCYGHHAAIDWLESLGYNKGG